jgi:hypothetical protein
LRMARMLYYHSTMQRGGPGAEAADPACVPVRGDDAPRLSRLGEAEPKHSCPPDSDVSLSQPQSERASDTVRQACGTAEPGRLRLSVPSTVQATAAPPPVHDSESGLRARCPPGPGPIHHWRRRFFGPVPSTGSSARFSAGPSLVVGCERSGLA